VIPVTVNVRCKTCGNEDEAVIAVDNDELGMVIENSPVIAKAQVRECRLCQRPLLGATS
jgi:hypothetical protein